MTQASKVPTFKQHQPKRCCDCLLYTDHSFHRVQRSYMSASLPFPFNNTPLPYDSGYFNTKIKMTKFQNDNNLKKLTQIKQSTLMRSIFYHFPLRPPLLSHRMKIFQSPSYGTKYSRVN